jgi:hypothetical protein
MDAILAALEALSEQRASQMQHADASTPLRAKPEPVAAPTPPFAQTAAPPPSVDPSAAGAPPSHVPAVGNVLQGMFRDGNSLFRAVIAAEVLGPPVALRQTYERPAEEPHFWKQQPNEPSI